MQSRASNRIASQEILRCDFFEKTVMRFFCDAIFFKFCDAIFLRLRFFSCDAIFAIFFLSFIKSCESFKTKWCINKSSIITYRVKLYNNKKDLKQYMQRYIVDYYIEVTKTINIYSNLNRVSNYMWLVIMCCILWLRKNCDLSWKVTV